MMLGPSMLSEAAEDMQKLVQELDAVDKKHEASSANKKQKRMKIEIVQYFESRGGDKTVSQNDKAKELKVGFFVSGCASVELFFLCLFLLSFHFSLCALTWS